MRRIYSTSELEVGQYLYFACEGTQSITLITNLVDGKLYETPIFSTFEFNHFDIPLNIKGIENWFSDDQLTICVTNSIEEVKLLALLTGMNEC